MILAEKIMMLRKKSGWSQEELADLSENMAGGLGAAILLTIIAVAVGIMILSSLRIGKYSYLEKEAISLQYGVQGIVQKKKENFNKTFYICISIGVMSCILGVVPLIITGAFIEDGFPLVVCTAVLLAMVALGVFFFVWSGIIYGCYDKLLQQGEYTEENKALNKEFERKMGFVPGAYWCIVTAIFLGISFTRNNWDISWIIWPVAGVTFAALMTVLKGVVAKQRKAE